MSSDEVTPDESNDLGGFMKVGDRAVTVQEMADALGMSLEVVVRSLDMAREARLEKRHNMIRSELRYMLRQFEDAVMDALGDAPAADDESLGTFEAAAMIFDYAIDEFEAEPSHAPIG